MYYVATFHTHFGALSFKKKLAALGDSPTMMPVPRVLSSSCGTCVRFTRTFDSSVMYDEDIEKVFLESDGKFTVVFENE